MRRLARLITAATLSVSALWPGLVQAREVIIGAGQSNAVGLGPVSAVVQTQDAHVRYWDGTAWVQAKEPLIPGGGYGPLTSMGQHLVSSGRGSGDRVTDGVDIIPCAVGGTTIAQWASSLMPRCMQMAKDSGETPTGLFFYQGESDATDYYQALYWPYFFAYLVQQVRAAYGPIPVVYVQIGQIFGTWVPSFPFWFYVQTRQRDAEGLYNVAMVSTYDLGLNYNADGTGDIHLSPASEYTLGQEAADKYKRLTWVTP